MCKGKEEEKLYRGLQLYRVDNGLFGLFEQGVEVVVLYGHGFVNGEADAVAKTKGEASVLKYFPGVVDGDGHYQGVGGVFAEDLEAVVGKGTRATVARAGAFGVDNNRAAGGLDVFAHLLHGRKCLTGVFAVDKYRATVLQVEGYTGDIATELYLADVLGMVLPQKPTHGHNVENALMIGYQYQGLAFGKFGLEFNFCRAKEYVNHTQQKEVKSVDTLFMRLVTEHAQCYYLDYLKDTEIKDKQAIGQNGNGYGENAYNHIF